MGGSLGYRENLLIMEWYWLRVQLDLLLLLFWCMCDRLPDHVTSVLREPHLCPQQQRETCPSCAGAHPQMLFGLMRYSPRWQPCSSCLWSLHWRHFVPCQIYRAKDPRSGRYWESFKWVKSWVIKTRKQGLRDSLAVKSTHCSCRRPSLGFRHPHEQLTAMHNSSSREPKSSGLRGHQNPCAHFHTEKHIQTHNWNVKLRKTGNNIHHIRVFTEELCSQFAEFIMSHNGNQMSAQLEFWYLKSFSICGVVKVLGAFIPHSRSVELLVSPEVATPARRSHCPYTSHPCMCVCALARSWATLRKCVFLY